jgi:putative membrane-bound dehydrogenase-like protein
MISLSFGLWIAVSSTLAAVDDSVSVHPRCLDPRLTFERIAAEPEIVTPTGIAVDRQGRLLVIESHTHFRPEGYRGPPADRVRVFEDRNHDGRPECVGSFVEGTRKSMNLAVAPDGTVFLATRSMIYQFEDRDEDGRADHVDAGKLPAPILRLDTPGDYPHNGLSGFAFDCDGTVYFSLGENLGANYRLIGSDGTILTGGGEGGNIYRCLPNGSKLERVATGFWNPFHIAFDAFGRLFAVDNDPDSRPPCRLLHIVAGGDYGYRFRNGRKGLHPFTAWNGELPGTLGMVAGTGEAPSGVLACDSSNLPEDYRGTLLVTSWGDHRIEQYRLEPHGASFRATMKPVVVGGENFRPVGIAMAPDGAVYFSDWVDKSYTLHRQGRIWRLRGAHSPLGSRLNSHVDKPTPKEVSRLAALALKVLAAKGRLADAKTAAQFLRSTSADVRALAVRLTPASLVDLKATAATDPSLLVRAEALRRMADPMAKYLLLKALESDDPFMQQASRHGLERSLKTDDLVELVRFKDAAPARRLGLLLILRDLNFSGASTLIPEFLADPDPTIKFAAIQWVGEHGMKVFHSQLLAGLTSSAATRNLFEGTLASLELLDGKGRNPSDEVAGEDYIAALLSDPQTPGSVLRRGLRMLRPDHPKLRIDLLRRFLNSSDGAVQLEALRTLCQSQLRDRFDVLAKLADDRHAPISLRAEAIVGLADDAGRQRNRLLALATGAEPMIRREALRGLRGVKLAERDLSALLNSSRTDESELELLKLLPAQRTGSAIPSDRENGAATAIDAWLARLEGPADASAGERVFFHSKGPGCFRCHQFDGRGSRNGPDLSTLAGTLDRRRLVESIIAPSKEIAPQFVTWSVAKTDGSIVSGFLLEQSPEGMLIFVDGQGHQVAVKASEIAERRPQTTSIMPEDLVKIMTIQEFRDILALLSHGGS